MMPRSSPWVMVVRPTASSMVMVPLLTSPPVGLAGIDSTEEIQATFNGELADRHPPTGPASGDGSGEPEGREGVRLLTWGDPYLTAWLEALRGEPLSDDDYRTAGLQRDTNPFESA
jgi:hypothetical protein